MENCDKISSNNNSSYQRIRDLVCQNIEPYREKVNYQPRNNYKFLLLFMFIIVAFFRIFFYRKGATNLSK